MKIFLVLLLLTACGKKKEEVKDSAEIAAEAYKKGVKKIMVKDFALAIKSFETAEKENPYSDIAKKSSVLTIFSHYALDEYIEVPPLADVYEKLYPKDENVPYVLYMKSLSIFRQVKNHRKNLVMLKELQDSVDYIQSNFPETQYSDMLRPIREYSVESQIMNAFEVAVFYEKKTNYIAAANRYIWITNHPEASSEMQQMARDGLARCKENLGIAKL